MGLLTSLFERRSLENPSTPLSAPDDWLFDSLGSFRASSGVNVNRETALTYDAYWRCIALISGDIGKMPLCVYQHQAGAGRVEDEAHPAYRLLKYEVSPEIDALSWKRVMAFHALTEGNGYSYVVRDGAGAPLELWPLSPMKTFPVREDRRLWYVTEFGTGDGKQQRKLPMEDVFHLKGLSFDGLVGYAAVAKMRETLGLGIAHQNFGSIFFRNNARPNIVLKHPGRLRPEAKTNLRESWERLHSGLENAHRTAILEEGMDVVTIMHNARDSMLLESKHFSRTEIANFFGVPVHKVAERDGNSSYGSLEQENEQYVEDGGGLGYWLPAFAMECWRKLLSAEERTQLSHVVEFNTRKLLRANVQARTQYYVAMLQNGVLSPDEVREEEGYNPRGDGAGGNYMAPLNMKGSDQSDNEDQDQELSGKGKKKKKRALPAPLPALPAPDGFPPAAIEAHAALVEDAAGRVVRRLAHAAARAAVKPAGFLGWLDTLQAEHGPTVSGILGPAIRAVEVLAGASVSTGGLAGYTQADVLVSEFREGLLEVAGRARPGDLASMVEEFTSTLASACPRRLAQQWVAELRKTDEPGRSVDEALAILEQIPERRPGQILPLFPVVKQPPYLLTAEILRDLWAADRVQENKVRLRLLIATQDWLDKDEVRRHLEALDQGKPAAVETLNIEGSPADRAYVVNCQGQLYIYDGHHRLTAKALLAIGKTKTYVIDGDDL